MQFPELLRGLEIVDDSIHLGQSVGEELSSLIIAPPKCAFMVRLSRIVN
jgi:hypothetical protein